MSKAYIKAVEYFLPDHCVTNEDLAREFGDWTVDKIAKKTGIERRYIVAPDQCASDLGVGAAQRLFASGIVEPKEIDFLLFCTQSPDYFLPTTACVMQERLRIPSSAGALDFNLGCSGFVYGLGLAKGLIETGQVTNVLLITADTYSRFMGEKDRSVRTLFGDAGAATLVSSKTNALDCIGPFVYGTDGTGRENLIVPAGGLRRPSDSGTGILKQDDQGNERSLDNLFMNGSEILNFTLKSVPALVDELIEASDYGFQDIDLFVFHQANRFMLDLLRKKCRIPEDRFVYACQDFGNTVSCTIPIALKESERVGQLASGMRIMLVGFGVGYSWGATLLEW